VATPSRPPRLDTRLDELTARARRVIATGTAHPTPAVPPPDRGCGTAELVLGIDPGTAITGYGLVRLRTTSDDLGEAVAYGAIETHAEAPMPLRLLTLYRRLGSLIAEHRPAQAAVEQLFFGRNTTTAISVGQARGVVLLALAEAGVPITEYTAAEVKQSLAGFGRADKVQMQRMVQALLDLPEMPQPDDAADALAIALCHLRAGRRRAQGLPR
jgi:crossover junction endodeoxyribonuclease RuvC